MAEESPPINESTDQHLLAQEFEQINELKNQLLLFLAEKGVALVIAILIVVFGFWLGRKLADWVLRFCERKKMDSTLARFFAGSLKLLVIAFAFMIGLQKAGIEITPFVALLGASAFGLSLAVQGPISNYGAGIVLIITRPFKVGDTLRVNEFSGVVDEIRLGFTELLNEDDERITIPNRQVLGQVLTNSYAHTKYEGIVGIAYEADPEQAITVIREALKDIEGMSTEHQPDVGIDAFGDSSIDIGYRVMIETCKLHKTRYRVNLAVFQALRKAGITIPFPQRDVHLIRQSPD